jgi:hypothetical protein
MISGENTPRPIGKIIFLMVCLFGMTSFFLDQVSATVSVSSNAAGWSNPKHISTNARLGAFIPELEADANGRLMVVYNQEVTPGVENPFYSQSLDGGASWTTPSSIHSSGETSHEVTLAFDNNNVPHAVWRTEKKILHAKKSGWPTAATTIVAATNKVLSPAVAVDGNNRLHVVWSQQDNKIYYSRSQDGGANWSAPVALSGATDKSVLPSIAADQGGNVHVVWQERISSPTGFRFEIHYKKGVVSGSSTSWDATPKILSSGVTEARFPTILAQGNDLHVAFARRETAEEQYAYYTHFKPDSGWSSPVDTTMDNPVIINTNVPFVLNSTMAYCNNRLYLYYDGALAPNGKERILGANNASGWLPRDEANNGLLRSIRPSMVCMDGELHIAFDIVVQPDVDHQIYYLNNGVVTGDGSDGSVALPIILKK